MKNLFSISGKELLLGTQTSSLEWDSGSCPGLQQLRLVEGQEAVKKNLAFHIKIQDIAGGSLVLILEDFKAVCLQVEFQGRDANDLW